MTAANDQEPVKALGADGPHPPLREGVGVGRLHRCHQHLSALGAEHVVEPAAELRVTIAKKKPHPASSFLQLQQQVVRLPGDPASVGIGSHPGQVHPPSAQLDEAQRVQPPQPDGADGEEVTSNDPGGLPAQECPPGGGRWPRRRVQPVAAYRGADRGRRHARAKPEQLALDALVAPARVLPGQADDKLLQLLVGWRSPCCVVRVGPGAGDQAPMSAQQRVRGPGSPGLWRRRRGQAGRAVGWCGTGCGRRAWGTRWPLASTMRKRGRHTTESVRGANRSSHTGCVGISPPHGVGRQVAHRAVGGRRKHG